MKTRITEAVVAKLEAADQDAYIRDSVQRGFGVRARVSGAKKYFIEYAVAGRRRRKFFARVGQIPVVEARRAVQEWQAEIVRGVDPFAEARQAITFAEVSARFAREYLPRKSSRSQAEDRRQLDRYILPALGAMGIKDVDLRVLDEMHRRIADRAPIQANRCIALVSKILNLAERWGYRPNGSNPARHVERAKERRRRRALSEAEWRRLWSTLAEMEADPACRLSSSVFLSIRLIALTGCRKSEILLARWEDLDTASGRLHLPTSKTGESEIYLGPAALELIARAPVKPGNPYIAPGAGTGPLTGMLKGGKQWGQIRERAGIPDVRLHDLRRSFVSAGMAVGHSAEELMEIARHRSHQVARDYRTMQADRRRASVAAIEQRILKVAGGVQ